MKVYSMNIKNRFLLLVMAACICMPTKELNAVKLSTVGKVIGASAALTAVSLVGIDLVFELQDTSSVYLPISPNNQQCYWDFKDVETIEQKDLESFMYQVKEGLTDHAVIAIDPFWFSYNGLIFDRREEHVTKLFQKAKENAPSVIVMQDTNIAALFQPFPYEQKVKDAFMQEVRAIKESGESILVDEQLVKLMTKKKKQFKNNILAENLSHDEKYQYLQDKFQHIKTSENVDISLMNSLLQGEFNWAQLIKFVGYAQGLALKDDSDTVNFKHVYKAYFSDEIYIHELRCKVLIALYGNRISTAYHEAAHAIVPMHKNIGSSVLGLSVRPFNRFEGLTSFAQFDDNKTDVQRYNWIMTNLAGAVAEREFGFYNQLFFKNLDDALEDLLNNPKLIGDMIEAYKTAFDIVALSDKSDAYEFGTEEERKKLLDEVIKKAYRETIVFIHEHRADVEDLAETLLQEEILSAKEIRQILRLSDK